MLWCKYGLLVSTMLCALKKLLWPWVGSVPIQLWHLTATYLAFYVHGFLRQATGTVGKDIVGHAAHLGGALSGAVY